jgi:hypothetical protein
MDEAHVFLPLYSAAMIDRPDTIGKRIALALVRRLVRMAVKLRSIRMRCQ